MAFERIISSVSGVFIVHEKRVPVSNELERGSFQLSQKIQLHHIHLRHFAQLDKGYRVNASLVLCFMFDCVATVVPNTCSSWYPPQCVLGFKGDRAEWSRGQISNIF
jgi:hypothetical protein